MSSDIIIIKLRRVGLLIGQIGKNIDALQEFLKKKIHVIEVDNHIEDAIIPVDNSKYGDYE